jgi:hypothetical protein
VLELVDDVDPVDDTELEPPPPFVEDEPAAPPVAVVVVADVVVPEPPALVPPVPGTLSVKSPTPAMTPQPQTSEARTEASRARCVIKAALSDSHGARPVKPSNSGC